jgi:hypothetical protein
MKKVVIKSIANEPGEEAVILGQMVDREDGTPPVGTTEMAEEMLAGDPRGQFDRYAGGWSNGYVQTRAA